MSWSLSRLKTFESCNAKFDFQYNLKLDRGPSSPAAQRGVDIHKDIENSIKGTGPPTVEIGHVDQIIAAHKASGVECIAEFNVYLDREWKGVITGDYWYHGIIDFYVRESPTTAVIRDWKTGKIYPDHDQQKELYALAMFCLYPELEEIRTYWDYIDLGSTRAKTYHAHMVPPAKQRWGARVAAMEQATEFIPTPGYHCRYCNYSKYKGGPCRF